MSRPSRASRRQQQPQGTKSRGISEQGNVLAEVQTPSLVEAVLPVPGVLALPALVRGKQGGFPCQGSCRRVAELVHVWRSEGESSGSEASLVQPKRQLVFPEPVQHPRGKPDSERQPKNSCPGLVHSPERRGSEKGEVCSFPRSSPQPSHSPQLCSRRDIPMFLRDIPILLRDIPIPLRDTSTLLRDFSIFLRDSSSVPSPLSAVPCQDLPFPQPNHSPLFSQG